ncbi:profilin-2 [Bombina bombina]|uniref:profilin-2 n=1 Tax=Bombina bombina TaxID=8345 RepID=UPI00235B1CA0|nr:profilin-2 [Bombina bombina]
MSGWQDYVDMLMADGSCQEAAIVGYVDAKYVWATTPGGFFQTLTPRGRRLQLLIPVVPTHVYVVDLAGLGEIALSPFQWVSQANLINSANWELLILVFAMGKEGVHGGGLNKKAFAMVKYLRDMGF